MCANLQQTTNICIVGGPGTGKTTQIQVGAANAMKKGLNVAVTALMAVRAKNSVENTLASCSGYESLMNTWRFQESLNWQSSTCSGVQKDSTFCLFLMSFFSMN